MYVKQKTWIEYGPRASRLARYGGATRSRCGCGVGDALPSSPIDTGGVPLASGGAVLPADVTAAALDVLPATGLPAYVPILYTDTSATPTSSAGATTVNWWLVAAAGAVFGLALLVPSGGKGRR